MKQTLGVSLVAAMIAASAFAQPSVSGLQNNYSYLVPGAANYGIAEGSIFIIYGKNIGPATLAQQTAYPLNKNLGGVTISVTVGGVTTTAIPYYVSAGQIAAILPAATPVGTGTITVAYGGQTSAAAPIVVVQSAFGILTMNNAGSGAAAAFDSKNSFLGPNNAANPGDTIVLWGTGIGPASGDETNLQTPTNLSNINTQIWIGGKSATVSYRGRSAYPGLDQINVVIPGGVSGCSVGLVVQNGNYVSNFVSIPVAASGRTCSDPTSSSVVDLSSLLNKPTVSYGIVGLSRTTASTAPISVGGITIPGQTTTTESASGTFIRLTNAQLTANYGQLSQSSFGSCIVTTYIGKPTTATATPFTLLDAGNISLNGPGGTKQLQKQQGFYSADLGTNYIGNGGAFTFTGSGGTDVGGFTTNLNVTNPVKWTNIDTLPTNIPRAQGVTVTWTGGDAASTVEITGLSLYATSTDTSTAVISSFVCTEKASAGTFTVPSYVLLALPVSGIAGLPAGASFAVGNLAVGNVSNLVPFTATGLDFGYATWDVISSKSVNYQ